MIAITLARAVSHNEATWLPSYFVAATNRPFHFHLDFQFYNLPPQLWSRLEAFNQRILIVYHALLDPVLGHEDELANCWKSHDYSLRAARLRWGGVCLYNHRLFVSRRRDYVFEKLIMILIDDFCAGVNNILQCLTDGPYLVSLQWGIELWLRERELVTWFVVKQKCWMKSSCWVTMRYCKCFLFNLIIIYDDCLSYLCDS